SPPSACWRSRTAAGRSSRKCGASLPTAATGFPSPLWGGARGGGTPDFGCSAIPPTLSLPHKGGGGAVALSVPQHRGIVPSMPELMQFLFSGLTVGAIYALIALGFTIIYNSSDVVNFAQGEFVMIGGMVTFFLFAAGVPLWMAAPLAILVAVAV